MCCQEAQVLFLAQYLQCFGRVAGSNNGFVEELADLLRGGCVYATVAADDAAVGGDRVATMGLFIGIHQRIAAGQSARIGMLDNNHRWRGETTDRRQGSIEIEQVIEGEFFAV